MSDNKNMFKYLLLAGYKLIIVQTVLLAITVLFFAFISGWQCVTSTLFGGCAWIIPNIYFVKKVFNSKKNLDPGSILSNFLFGETIKLLLSIGIIILILFSFKNIKAWGFLSGYIVTIFASFLMPFLYTQKNGY